MRKPTKSSLKNKLDKEISRIVRARGKCQFCGLEDYSKLQCCHIFSRSNLAVRWLLLNLLCLCAGCHFWSHKNPVLFAEKVKELLGEYNYRYLKNIANSIYKWTLEEMIELLETLRKVE